MDAADFDRWAASFEAFHARFADLFARRESRQQAAKYLRGLLASVERKNAWQVAEAVGDATPDRTQRLLYRVEWDADAARDRLQQFIIETFGDPDGIGVIDETGFVKQGRGSVGVARQYSGTAGKVDNCQIATVLSYVTPHGHVLLDRRLFLPEAWVNDATRRQKAKVPDEVGFQTKPEQALMMLESAWEQGVPMRWVTGDEVYGNSPYLRDGIDAHGRWYVLAVSSSTPVWTSRPTLQPPQTATGGRPQTKPRLAEETPPSPVAEVVGAWPTAVWQRLTVAEGEKGPRVYDWARGRIVENAAGWPSREGWVLARRSVSDPTDMAYYLSNAPPALSLPTLADVAAQRYTVEQCIQQAKSETGLDEYEVRFWHSWHRHITLSMMAYAWLAAVRQATAAEKGGRTPTWPT